jgi:alanine racemase
MKTRLTTATTNLTTLNQNIVALKSCLQPKTKFMAVIKANAYGHGAVEIAKHLEDTKSADYFGVACIF